MSTYERDVLKAHIPRTERADVLRQRMLSVRFRRCTHINTTLANKLFDYMSVGEPVLASDAAPMVGVPGETGAAATFHSGNADFATVLSVSSTI